MTTYTYTEKQTLVFWPVVNGAGEIDLSVSYDTNSTQQSLSCCDIVMDEIDRTATVTQVKIEARDDGSYTMWVDSTRNANAWYRTPVAAPTQSEYNADIPLTSGDENVLAMLILAKNSGGAVVAKRTQIVIVKHRVA